MTHARCSSPVGRVGKPHPVQRRIHPPRFWAHLHHKPNEWSERCDSSTQESGKVPVLEGS